MKVIGARGNGCGGFARAMGGTRERRRREINTPTYYGLLYSSATGPAADSSVVIGLSITCPIDQLLRAQQTCSWVYCSPLHSEKNMILLLRVLL